MQKLEEQELISKGLAKKIQLSEEEREKHGYKKTKLEIHNEDAAKRALQNLHDTKEYMVLSKHKAILKAEEARFLASAEEFYSDSNIWKFCEHVRGLGSVAALTFFTVLNTEEISRLSGSRVITAGKLWKYLGLAPGQRLESGKLGGFNTIMKGRTWMVSRNVIMSNDPYYGQLYRIQKELYKNRPDIIAENGFVLVCPMGHYTATQQKEGDVYCYACKKTYDMKSKMGVVSSKKRAGWNKWVDAMASRWMRKTLLSHVTEIIATAEGYQFSKHSNYIPPKPKGADELQTKEMIEKVLETFKQERIELLDKYMRDFSKSGNGQEVRDNMLSYWGRATVRDAAKITTTTNAASTTSSTASESAAAATTTAVETVAETDPKTEAEAAAVVDTEEIIDI